MLLRFLYMVSNDLVSLLRFLYIVSNDLVLLLNFIGALGKEFFIFDSLSFELVVLPFLSDALLLNLFILL